MRTPIAGRLGRTGIYARYFSAGDRSAPSARTGRAGGTRRIRRFGRTGPLRWKSRMTLDSIEPADGSGSSPQNEATFTWWKATARPERGGVRPTVEAWRGLRSEDERRIRPRGPLPLNAARWRRTVHLGRQPRAGGAVDAGSPTPAEIADEGRSAGCARRLDPLWALKRARR